MVTANLIGKFILHGANVTLDKWHFHSWTNGISILQVDGNGNK